MNNNFIQINSKNIHYKIIKKKELKFNKPVIIFLHEGLGSILQWRNFPEKLCNILNLPGLLYDRYGHGKSDALVEKRDSNFLHKEADIFLPKIIKQLIPNKKYILFGHSDGGTLALIYAGKQPPNLIAAISEAHHVVLEEHSYIGVKKAVEAYKKGKLDALELFHPNKKESMFYGWAETWLNTSPDWNALDSLKNIKCPVLSIQGDNDQYGTKLQLDVLHKYCSEKVETCLIKNCGHIPHLEQQDIVIEKTKQFIYQYIIKKEH